MNDWLVEQHQTRSGTPPELFIAGGIAAFEAIRRAGGAEDTEARITAMEGREFETPQGTMRFRPEDHQALPSIDHFRIRVQDGVEWAIPDLVREIGIGDMNVPVRNTR